MVRFLGRTSGDKSSMQKRAKGGEAQKGAPTWCVAFVGLVHNVEMGNLDDLIVLMSAGVHGHRLGKFDGEKREIDEVGAAVQVWRTWMPIKAQTKVQR